MKFYKNKRFYMCLSFCVIKKYGGCLLFYPFKFNNSHNIFNNLHHIFFISFILLSCSVIDINSTPIIIF